MNKSIRNMRNPQKGVATVESAIIIVVFLMLVMGIMEFALLIFNVSSLVDATRFGTRYLTVNDPVVQDLKTFSCDELPKTISCDETSRCDDIGLVSYMQGFSSKLNPENIVVTYSCSSAGYDEAYFNVYEVEMQLEGVEYNFITPGILGFDGTITLPDFLTTRLSEDLEYVPPAE